MKYLNSIKATWRRIKGIAKKEFLQLSRDRLTAILLISVPIAQILLFGFAIDLNSKHWPSAWVSHGSSQSVKFEAYDKDIQSQIIDSINQTQLLAIRRLPMSEREAYAALQSGEVRFILQLPAAPSHYLNQTLALPILLTFDGSDPYVAMTTMLISKLQTALATSTTFAATSQQEYFSQKKENEKFPVTQISLQSEMGDIKLTSQSAFLQTSRSGAYLVPALVGVILTLTLTLMAAFSLVRERERGTWQSLMSMPVNASLIVCGKLSPYAAIGLLLFALLQSVAHQLFETPWASPAQWFAAICFILGQLGLGASLSLVARTQMQAMQLGVFFYLPSILLSGFMFPFHSMPTWAKTVGEFLPLTHFLRVLRADLFRQAEQMVLIELSLPILLFACLMLGLAILGYRRHMQ
ncbi:ABC transporter permease [Undibacterium umbellatum]|uniref:Transport permease protein n=1 Tax=Undibacterium umbellatum TaxID=2762300 RepID=A0ABR6ZHR0_9BURK|nr:ABC transporter permease [Undibacterium umbellatum]MBC3911268.1 ABC transporter permease [Undibacterium umbellatum]